FSSRRRHTRSKRDWSSDVCSSDLAWAQQYGIPDVYTEEDACYAAGGFDAVYIGTANHLHYAAAKRALQAGYSVILEKPFTGTARSEERRVGKEWTATRSPTPPHKH